MKLFKTEENLHPSAAEWLRAQGHDAVTVWDEGLRGRVDGEIAEACRLEKRILVTLDVAFADIRLYPPERYDGLLVLRLHNQSRASVQAVLDRVLIL